ARAHWRGEGFAADVPGGILAFLKSRNAADLPDVQFLFNAAPMTADPYLAAFRRAYPDAFACRAVLLRPESRGEVRLASADPAAAPRIRQNFLATEKDRKTPRDRVGVVR